MKKLMGLMLVWLPLVGWAQTDGKGLSSDGPRGMEGARMPPPTSATASPELTLSQVRDRLVLMPAQQPLWSAFESKVEAYANAYYRQKPVTPSQVDTAPRQIARLVDALQNRLAGLEEVETAAKNLYAGLNAEQQKLANQLLVAAIPTFAGLAGNANSPAQEGRRMGPKPEGGMRPRPGGGMGRGD